MTNAHYTITNQPLSRRYASIINRLELERYADLNAIARKHGFRPEGYKTLEQRNGLVRDLADCLMHVKEEV